MPTDEFVADDEDCVPSYGNAYAAGLDLRSAEEVILPYARPTRVRTGLRLAIPPGHVGLVRGRSGMAFKRGIWGFEGTIDEDYRGEINLLLMAMTPTLAGVTVIARGVRVAQLVIVPCVRLNGERVAALKCVEGGRGEAGFGSTGER